MVSGAFIVLDDLTEFDLRWGVFDVEQSFNDVGFKKFDELLP